MCLESKDFNKYMLISQFLYLQENQKHNSYSSASRYVESKAVYGELVDKLDTLRRL